MLPDADAKLSVSVAFSSRSNPTIELHGGMQGKQHGG